MNDQALLSRVADLAARTGFPVPAVTPDRAAKRAGIAFDPKTRVLHVPPEAEQKYPPYLQDFLIAQEFVQTRLGVHEKTQRMRIVNRVILAVVYLAVIVVLMVQLKNSWLAAMLPVIPLVIFAVALNLAISRLWTHPFLRRSDQQLVTVLVPEAVHAALTWLDEHYRGVKFTTSPLPRTRLAWLA